jgi:CheY-like chemotaxis protein
VLRTDLRSILVVDDDEAYRTILGKHLEQLCDRVRVTGDTQGAMATATRREVDALMLDIIMPDTDGLTMLQQIRADAVTADLPVVVCSSKALSADEQALLLRLGAPFLPKDGLTPARIARALLDARRSVAYLGRSLAGSAA